MSINKGKYTDRNMYSILLLVVTILRLMICLPFILNDQHLLQADIPASVINYDLDDSVPNPSTSDTDEKSTTIINEEYLIHEEEPVYSVSEIVVSPNKRSSSEYVAFHVELFCPPPNNV